jgi:RyR domain
VASATSVTDSADTATTSSYGKTFAKILATMKLPGIEAVAAKVHDAWVQAKRTQGITTRKSESGEELMVEYDQLSEDAKELDRASVRAVFDAIESLEREKD